MNSILNQHRRIYKRGKTYSPSTEYVLGALQVVENLLRKGEDAKATRYLREKFGKFLPFKYAVAYGYVKVVELLLSLGADPNVLGFLDQSPLHVACKPRPKMSKRIELRRDVIQALTSSYVEPIGAVVYDARDLIRDKVDLQMIKLLLKHKCNINVKSAFGQSPLFYTFMNYYDDPMFRLEYNSRDTLYEVSTLELEEMEKMQKEKLDILLNHDVDIKITDVNKNTALMFAVYNLEAKRRPNRYCNMAFNDNVLAEMILELLEKSIDVNAKDIYNRTALQYAVALLSADVVKILLEHGANADEIKFKFDDDTCFYYHNLLPCLEAVENLLDIIEILSDNGWKFSRLDNLAILKFLVIHGTNVQLATTSNVDFDFSNRLFYGTPVCIERILNDMISRGAREYFYEKCHHYMKFMNANGFYVDSNVKAKLQELDVLQSTCDVGYGRQENMLKTCSLSGNVTLYDLLSMHPFRLYPYLKFGNYRRFTRSSVLKDSLNWYNTALKGHITKALIRKYVLDSATDYLRYAIPNLPDLCYEEILQYLSNEEVYNFCAATINISTVKKKESKNVERVERPRPRGRCSIS